MAGLFARGQLSVDEPFSHKSILDTEFIGTIRGETEYFGMPAILSTIKGPAWVTGTAKWTVDPTDPFQNGYRLTDIWAAE
jgi:proline racemase